MLAECRIGDEGSPKIDPKMAIVVTPEQVAHTVQHAVHRTLDGQFTTLYALNFVIAGVGVSVSIPSTDLAKLLMLFRDRQKGNDYVINPPDVKGAEDIACPCEKLSMADLDRAIEKLATAR